MNHRDVHPTEPCDGIDRTAGGLPMRSSLWLSFAVLVIIGFLVLIGCSSSSKPGTVNVSLSDPPTCMAPQGPYLHVYVTVNDVQINQSANASNGDAGWLDLTPGLQQ